MTIFLRSLIAFISGILCLYLVLLNMPYISFYFSPMHDALHISQALILLGFFVWGFVTSALVVYLGMHRSYKIKLAAQKEKWEKAHKDTHEEQKNDLDNLLPPQ